MLNKESKRLFLALNPPADIREGIGRLIEALRGRNRGVKWINPVGAHFTLHFLGKVENKKEEEVKKIMAEIAKQFSPAQIRIGQIDAFPNLAQPRVIFLAAGQADSRSLFTLQKATGQELERLGIVLDNRRWRLHLTLGRARGRFLNFASIPIPERIKEPFSVYSFELMSSVLKPTGAEYKIEASFMFNKI